MPAKPMPKLEGKKIKEKQKARGKKKKNIVKPEGEKHFPCK